MDPAPPSAPTTAPPQVTAEARRDFMLRRAAARAGAEPPPPLTAGGVAALFEGAPPSAPAPHPDAVAEEAAAVRARGDAKTRTSDAAVDARFRLGGPGGEGGGPWYTRAPAGGGDDAPGPSSRRALEATPAERGRANKKSGAAARAPAPRAAPPWAACAPSARRGRPRRRTVRRPWRRGAAARRPPGGAIGARSATSAVEGEGGRLKPRAPQKGGPETATPSHSQHGGRAAHVHAPESNAPPAPVQHCAAKLVAGVEPPASTALNDQPAKVDSNLAAGSSAATAHPN